MCTNESSTCCAEVTLRVGLLCIIRTATGHPYDDQRAHPLYDLCSYADFIVPLALEPRPGNKAK